MAIFNPQVAQGRDDMPNYQRTSYPISELVPDKSAGLAYANAGTAVEGAAGLAKSTAEDYLKNKVRETVEPIREDFTKELELARQAQLGQSVVPPAVQSASGPTSGSTANLYMDANKQDAPASVDSGIKQVQSIQSALENGKVNDTYYTQRLKSAVTKLRSDNPGFVDYIDNQVSSITGINPANAYITNLMQDINQRQTQKKTELDRAIDDARKSGYPNSDVMVKTLRERGESFMPQYDQWYSEQTMFDAQIKRKDALRRDTQAGKAEVKENRTSDWTNEAGGTISSNLGTMVKISGLDQKDTILNFIQKFGENPDKYTQAQMVELGTKLGSQRAVLEAQLSARMNQQSKDSQGRTYSYASDVGATEAQNILQKQLGVYDVMGKALSEGKLPLAAYAANHFRAVMDQTKDNLVSNNEWAAKIGTFQEIMGPNWTNLVIQQSVRNNIDEKMRYYLDDNKLDARLGTNSVTMKQHLEAADRLQQEGKITAGMKSRYIGNLVQIVDDIKNKDAPDDNKINVLKYIFSPQGQGILSHISTDYTDPTTGKPVPGKYSVFNRLTAEDVVKEVGRLSKIDPSVGKMYKNYLEREAGGQLFQNELLMLNKFTGHDDIHIKYNDEPGGHGAPYITLLDRQGKELNVNTRQAPSGLPGVAPTPPLSAGYITQVQKIVNRVNEGMAGMARVENGLGGNPNEYLLQFLQRSQVDLGQNWTGLPQKLMDAIAASRAPARRIEDTFDNLKSK